MSESKRYWVVINYETEVEADTEWDACHDIRMGNTIVENATVIAKALPKEDSVCKELIQEASAVTIPNVSWEEFKSILQ